MADNTINIDLVINAAKSAKTLAEQRDALKDLRKGLEEVKYGSGAFELLTDAVSDLQKEMGLLNLTFEDAYGEIKPLTSQIGELEDRLYQMALAGQQNTDEFKQIQAETVRLKQALIDVDDTVDALAQRGAKLQGFIKIAQGIAGGFAIAQSGLKLFGVENQKVEASIQKTATVLELLAGLEALSTSFKEKNVIVLGVQNTLRAIAIRLAGQQAVAEAAEAAAAGTATIAQRALNAAMAANPIGILITLIVAGVSALALWSSKADKASEAEKRAAKEKEKHAELLKLQNEELKKAGEWISKEGGEYIRLADALKRTNPNSAERLKLIKEINSTYGTTIKNLQDEKKFQDQVNLSIEDYLDFLKIKYKAQKNEEYFNKNLAKQQENEQKIAKLQADDRKKRIKEEKELTEYNKLSFSVNKGIATEQQKLDLTALGAAKRRVDADRNARQETINSLKAENEQLDANMTKQLEYGSKLTSEIDKRGLKTKEAEKAEIKNAEKTLDTLNELYNKHADELIQAQNNLREAQLEIDESFYNEQFSEFEAYNTAYLAAFNAQQDESLNVAIAKNDEAEKEELKSAQETIDKVLAQYKKGSAEYQAQLKLGEDAKTKIVETYDLNGQKLIKQNNDTKVKKEQELQSKILEIRKNAKLQEIADLQESLSRAESSYTESLSILSKQIRLERIFPESSFEANITSDLEKAKTEIVKYLPEFDKIYQKQRESVRKAVQASGQDINGVFVQSEKDRITLNEKLNIANKVYLSDFKDLLAKITAETEIEFKNVNKIVTENGQRVFSESLLTIESYYNLMTIQSQLFAKSLSDDLTKITELPLKNQYKIFIENDKLIKKQFAQVVSSDAGIQDLLDKQIQSNAAINQIIGERNEKLQEINDTVGDEWERRFQIQKAYQDSSDLIAKLVDEDKKRFEKVSAGFRGIEEIKNRALLNLATQTSVSILATQKSFDIVKKETEKKIKELNDLGKNRTAEQEKDLVGLKEKAEKLKKEEAKELEKITTNSANKELEIKEKAIKDEAEMRRAIFQQSIDLILQANQIVADLITQQTETAIAQFERLKEERLKDFDDRQEILEMERNEATAADYQEVIRKRQIAEERSQIEDEFNEKIKAEKRRAFEAQKAASVIEIGINTAVAVSKLLANPILAVLVGIAGAAQAAFVAQQPTPEFAKGGILDGPSHSQGGIKTAYGELEGGEAVINKKSTKKFMPLLSAINEAGGGVKFAGGGTLPEAPMVVNDNNDLNEIKGMLREFASKPILTYVNESEVTRAQRNQKKIEKRTTF